MIAWTIYLAFAGAVLLLLLPRECACWIALLTTIAGLALDMIVFVGTPIPDLAHFTTIVRVTWVAALGLTLLTQMLLILGLSTALQFIVFGAAIIAGMLVSGDRIAALLGRMLRPAESSRGQPEMGNNPS